MAAAAAAIEPEVGAEPPALEETALEQTEGFAQAAEASTQAKAQKRRVMGGDGEGASFEISEAALAEAVAGSVLDPMAEELCIARLRGLPWSYGGKEVCDFLAGVSVNLQPEAVTMLHNAAGEAFVALPSAAMLHEVLQANHQQIGRRYVEIFASTAAEKAAACERNRATMRDDAGYRGVLRMRGLPFSATVEDIHQFFNSPSTLQLSNIHLMRKADGRSSGDAYAVFDSEEAAVEALQFDKLKLGTRWVDLFQSNKGELYSLTSLGGIMLGGEGANANGAASQSQAALGEGFSVIKLRGLPWNVTIDDIHTFLANITVPQGGVHLMNGANGRPSGLAYVELSTEEDQAEALRRDKEKIGGRYIDVFACSQTELQARLAGGLERGGVAGGGPNAVDAHFAKLRGLPYQATEQQIAGFFQPLQVVAVQIAFNASGQPSGFGFVQFRTPEDAAAALGRTNQVLGSRYVEVFRCSRAEMEQARMHALSVMPFMRGQQAMGGPGGMGGRGGHGAANGPGTGGHGNRNEGAYAAYQAALQTLAARQQQTYAASQAYPAAAAYGGADAYGASGAMNGAASYGAGYGSSAEAYGATAGYGQGTGYGQVAGGYAGGASAAAGYGTAPASAGGYASTGASAAQGSYYPANAAAGVTNGGPGYTAADYAQYSNYYYSPQTATYQ